MGEPRRDIPAWLTSSEHYRPGKDRDGFLMSNALALTSLLKRLRTETHHASGLAPNAVTKIACGLLAIILTSLSHSFFFVLVVLACALVRACLLPRKTLSQLMGGAAGAATLVLVVTLPAALIGQASSALTLATKTFVSCAIVLEVALTTPHAQLMGALRSLRMPSIVILTLDLTLHGIVSLGQRASETLCALRLRSVGKNRNKRASMGGVGGSVLLRANQAARDTHDAMCCRGFDGSYQLPTRTRWCAWDVALLATTAALLALFLYLQGA